MWSVVNIRQGIIVRSHSLCLHSVRIESTTYLQNLLCFALLWISLCYSYTDLSSHSFFYSYHCVICTDLSVIVQFFFLYFCVIVFYSLWQGTALYWILFIVFTRICPWTVFFYSYHCVICTDLSVIVQFVFLYFYVIVFYSLWQGEVLHRILFIVFIHCVNT